MRNTIFAAALIASTQAIKITNLSQVTSKAAQDDEEGSWCDNIHPDFSTMTNPLYEGQFDSGIQWYDNMGPFFAKMNASAAFYWFDCEHGNGDGKVNYTEYNAGLSAGYTSDEGCHDQLHGQWAEESGSDNINVSKDDYRKAQRGIYNDLWSALAGNKQADSVNFNQWMNNAMDSHALDVREAAVLWNQANNGTYSWNDQEMSKQQFQAAVGQNLNAQVDYYRNQYVLIENSLVLEPMWYFTQQCFDPASFWFALIRDPNTYGFDSQVELDYDQWMDQLCNNWELCEAKME